MNLIYRLTVNHQALLHFVRTRQHRLPRLALLPLAMALLCGRADAQVNRCLTIHCPPSPIEVTLGNFLPVVWGQPFPGTYVDYQVTATNTCTGSNVLADCEPPSGSLFAVGSHTVDCVAVDGVSRAGCSFQVVVKDAKPPTLPPRRPLFAPCNETLGDGTKGAHVSFAVSASDNIDLTPTVTCTPSSGSFFPLGTNHVICVAEDDSGNTATNSFDVIVYMGLGCMLTTLEEMPDNWGFELGLTAWEREGEAFADQPVQGDVIPVKRVATLKQQIQDNIGGDYWHDVAYPIGHRGKHWVGTAENINSFAGIFDDLPTEERKGTLRSKSFMIDHTYISFLIGGTEDAERLRVEILTQVDAPASDTVMYDGLHYKVRYYRTGHNREVMRWENWELNIYKGKRAIIRIIDQSATGHLNVDDFRFEDQALAYQKVKIGGAEHPAAVTHAGYYYHWDSPIWGYADTHTHPMSHLGFGGFVMHGEPDGNITNALRNCRCSHGGWGTDNECGDYLREIIMGVMDNDGPTPHYNDYNDDHSHPYNPIAEFNTWPVFWTITHQQMWHEWMKRTYDGGQRVLVALCVNNPLLGVATKGPLPNDDQWVGDHQIQALKEFVERHNDWMEIAYDPFQLRDIVRRNKLAIIIGSELDDIGNFAWNNSVNEWNPTDADKKAVTNEIDRLYGLGLRYIFPVHLMNNKYGGTAVCDDMLNVANRYLNHEPFHVESGAPADGIGFYLDDLDFTTEMDIVTAVGPAALATFPLIVPVVIPLGEAILASQGAPPGSGAALGAGLLPLGLLGATLLPVVGVEIGEAGIPAEVLPVDGHYTNYIQKGELPGWDYGHRNTRGLTPLGEFAITEMMKRGMMIDIDHMSHHVVTNVLAIAERNSIGYPLNSGHNSPRALGFDPGENSRTLDQLDRIRKLGGVFGVGYENSECRAFDPAWPTKTYTHSQVENDCAGTSKTFAQYYLYALEAMRGHGVALGTDINGLIPGPGPRFGPQAAFALPDYDPRRNTQIHAQYNGVRYLDGIERPITTPVFIGKAIDEKVEFGSPRTEYGFRYNIEQGDFFAAIRMYHWLEDEVKAGWSEADVVAKLAEGIQALHPSYPNPNRVLLYALGLLKGIHDWTPTGDIDPEVSNLQHLGKAVYISQVLQQAPPAVVYGNSALKPRYQRAVKVWQDYHSAFGQNVPLKPCQTGYKRWDINFEGVAHYGLIPDFLQDLHNTGLASDDMSVLFKSAEDFARMWTKTLDAAWAMVPHIVEFQPQFQNGTGLWGILITYSSDREEYQIEESDNLDPRSWQPATVEEIESRDNLRTVRIRTTAPAKFYRLHKR